MGRVVQGLRYLFDRKAGATNTLVARWLFLRALGVIYFSAFLALVFQIRGMVGVQGVLPAGEYLEKVQGLGGARVESHPDSSRYVDVSVLVGAGWRPPAQPFYP